MAAAAATPPVSQSAHATGTSLLGSITADNPYFQAGFGLMGVGVGITVLRRATVLASVALRRRLLVTLEINNKDRSYAWFLSWLAHHQRTARRPAWAHSHQLSVETTYAQRNNGSADGPGVHWLKYRGAWMQVKRERETRAMQMASGTPWETARDTALQGQEGRLVVHTAWGAEWRPFGLPRGRRPLRSVVLARGVAERIAEDARAFLARREWYADRGIPYRRGYLLHGPPGSGKSSFIQALAGSLSYDICLLNLSERGLTDDKLNHLMSNAPERSFILIEDVDAAFNKRVQTSEDGYQSSVTFSGFLNALDGVASGEERIIFLTTNHIERLDPALIRPGRVDLAALIDDADPEQAKTLFTNFYGTEQAEGGASAEVEQLGNQLREIVSDGIMANRRISMAALQGTFIRYDAKDAVASTRELLAAQQ
ncbi:mitochondrial chaperone BCS1 [Lactarius akahatsu]|uniref:Mitochondrial chaperone BCS1 n=1 Tax=Lactarius akahatsu TaxID=416441 RepID=A0AAD4LP42_9AGAM|nr:mitochondrial chaperone BCS1 [Lactarius akahatsu]